jgi:hypothetical protein
MRRLDRMLVVLVLLLAGLVAFFPVRNSDFWLHLAAGRDWLAGKYSLGQDPYSYTGNGTWVNHSWLYGVLFYGLYTKLGGAAVVILKTVLMVVLAGLLLRTRRRGESLWIPGVCTALAIVAMVPRLFLQPTLFSYVLLALTLLLLLRGELRDPPAGERKRRPQAPVPWLGEPADRALWLLPVIFALWVNLDAWFVAGLFAVVLYLVGAVLQGVFDRDKAEAPPPGAWRPLLAVLAASIVACLLNPYFVRAFALPGEIGARTVIEKLQKDDLFARLLTSPLEHDYRSVSVTVAGIAYFPLVLAGLLSFWLNWGHWRWGRALVWACFLLLSAVLARAIPFFAVVAGPITALNLQEYGARRFGTIPIAVGWWKEWSLAGRGLSVLGVLLLAALAWPGWLLGFTGDERRVSLDALKVQPPTGMTKLAQRLTEWRRDGTLRDEDHGLNLQPQAASVLAWLCPEHTERCFFDYRFENYSPEIAEEYVQLREAFDWRREGEKGLGEEAEDWLPILKRHGITYVIVTDPPRGTFEAARARCTRDLAHLMALHVDGHTAVFVPRGQPLKLESNPYLDWLKMRAPAFAMPPPPPPPGTSPGRFGAKEFDTWPLAFGPQVERLPDVKPRPPQPLAWWMRFAYGPGPRTAESADALTYLNVFLETRYTTHYRREMLGGAIPACVSLVGAAAGCRSPLGGALVLAQRCQPLGFKDPDYWAFWSPPQRRTALAPVRTDELGALLTGRTAPLMLSVRSARRAIQKNPDDATAYYHLAHAYLALLRQTEERRYTAGGIIPLMGGLRQAVILAALRNTVQLAPDHADAHSLLSALYGQGNHQDLQWKHMSEYLRIMRTAGPAPGETDEQFEERIKKIEKRVSDVEKQVKDNQNLYEVRAEKKPPVEKAKIALQLGLGEKALQELRDTSAVELMKDGLRLELDLFLSMGRVEELRELLIPSDPKETELRESMPGNLNGMLGPGSFETYLAMIAAAEGDYQEADSYLKEVGEKLLTDPASRQRFRQQLELEMQTPGPAKDLNLRQLIALGVGRVMLESAPSERGPVSWLLVRFLQKNRPFQAALDIAQPVQVAAGHETLRGVLRLECGDIEGARKIFREVLLGPDNEGKPLPDENGFDAPGPPPAYHYLKMIEGKE